MTDENVNADATREEHITEMWSRAKEQRQPAEHLASIGDPDGPCASFPAVVVSTTGYAGRLACLPRTLESEHRDQSEANSQNDVAARVPARQQRRAAEQRNRVGDEDEDGDDSQDHGVASATVPRPRRHSTPCPRGALTLRPAIVGWGMGRGAVRPALA